MSLATYLGPLEAEDDSDEDERQQRNEHELEQAALGFNDEAPVRHDEIPAWEPEEGGQEEWFRNRERSQFHSNRRGSGNLFEGQIFINGVAFKECVLDYALRNIRQYRYDKTKIGYNCVAEGCEWRVYCSISGKTSNWQIKVFKSVHSCVPNEHCDMIRVPVIARLFLHKIRDEPEYYMPMKIEELMFEKWKIVVSRPQCQAARNKALRIIDREYAEQFARLRDFASEIRLSNPGSTVQVETVQNEAGLDVFDRFYVCFDSLRRSWKETCRPLIGVDGCFLRGKLKGQFLVALGRDGNNAIYPIAWGVVQVENTANWLWFVNKVKEDLGLGDGEGYILVSDRQKGLIKAVQLELPSIEHRMCVRHIYGNLKAKHGKKTQMKPFIWNLAWSYNEAEYNENLDRLFCYDVQVHEDVMKSNPRTWCRAFYKIGNHCEDVENNSTESFNNTIVGAREKPLVPMLETVARLAMVRIAKRASKAEAHKGLITPYANDFLKYEHDMAVECQVHRSTNMNFQVMFRGCAYRVCLDKRTCSCKKWDICGIPCEHAYAAIMKVKHHVEDYVSKWFRTCLWRRTYLTGLTPTRGSRFWPTGEEGAIHEPPEPPQPGRKKKDKRKKGINESPAKKKKRKKDINESSTSHQQQEKQSMFPKRVMTCKVCGQQGHNSRRHKRSNQATQVEPSQGIVTQD